MRTNGFEKPFNGMQISTWVLLPLLPLQYLAFLTPTLPPVISIPMTIVYLISAIIAAYSGYITTKTDSIDHLLHQHLRGSPHPQANLNATAAGSEEGDIKYCWVCQTSVHNQSMHCKYCDKCVSKFDHHCMWLNTCIGSANYKTFFQTVIWTFTFVSLHVATLTIYLALYFLDDASVRSLAKNWWGGADASLIVVGFNIGFLVFTSFCAFMILQLLVFHLGLRREQITTYQYIIRDTARKRDRMMLAHKVRQRRVQELQNAGNGFEALCLKAGSIRCFKTCDPVRSLVLSEMAQEDNNGQPRAEDSSDSDDDVDESGPNDDDDIEKKEEIEEKNETTQVRSIDNSKSAGNGSDQSAASSNGKQKNTPDPSNGAVTSDTKDAVCSENDTSGMPKNPIFIKVDEKLNGSAAGLSSLAQKHLTVERSSTDSESDHPISGSSNTSHEFLP